jgi:hypothetical protein
MAAQPQDIERNTPVEIDQRIYALYDEYCHGRMDRREFLARAAALVVGGLAMAQALFPRYVEAQTISFTDSRIKSIRPPAAPPVRCAGISYNRAATARSRPCSSFTRIAG